MLVSCMFAILNLDPFYWDCQDIDKWLRWLQNAFLLDSFDNINCFPDNGIDLCNLTSNDFINLTQNKEIGLILFQNLYHLKRGNTIKNYALI